MNFQINLDKTVSKLDEHKARIWYKIHLLISVNIEQHNHIPYNTDKHGYPDTKYKNNRHTHTYSHTTQVSQAHYLFQNISVLRNTITVGVRTTWRTRDVRTTYNVPLMNNGQKAQWPECHIPPSLKDKTYRDSKYLTISTHSAHSFAENYNITFHKQQQVHSQPVYLRLTAFQLSNQ